MMDHTNSLRLVTNGENGFLPFEIIIEILSRLPIRALARFATVCKLWYTLITSRSFIISHLKNYSSSIANNPSTTSLYPFIFLMPLPIYPWKKYSYSLLRDSTFVEHGTFNIPMFYSRIELLFVGNSSNGIICFVNRGAFSGRDVFLYNPSIRVIKQISHNCFVDAIYGCQKVYLRLGFGFCECSSDFKVVRIHYVKDETFSMLGSIPPEAEVYSLNANCWTKIRVNIKCIVNHNSVSCNGIIYWLGRTHDEQGCDIIVSFDIANEVFSEIALPADCNGFRDGTILVFKGLLALFKDAFSIRENEGFKCYELWVLREYNQTRSWTNQYSFKTDHSVSKAFGFTNNGKLMMEMYPSRLAYWDPENNLVKYLKVDGFVGHVDAAFAESLVLYGHGTTALADTTEMIGGTTPSIKIMKPQDSYKIVIHGDEVIARVASDVTAVDNGVKELKNLCRRQRVLVGYISEPQDMGLTLQLCVESYCLTVQGVDPVPQSLKDFLANPEIFFLTVGTDKLKQSLFKNLEINAGDFHRFIGGFLKNRFVCDFCLELLADIVGVTLGVDKTERDRKGNITVLGEEGLERIVYDAYAYYKIGDKVIGLL